MKLKHWLPKQGFQNSSCSPLAEEKLRAWRLGTTGRQHFETKGRPTAFAHEWIEVRTNNTTQQNLNIMRKEFPGSF
jgi:hypothetical protein